MPKYTISDLKQFASEKGGDCLSEKYVDNETSYTWKCANNHIFQKVWVVVKTRGGWCASCKTGNGIDSLKKYAEEKGGKCLSTLYKRGDSKYEFECANGHHFSCTWNNLKFNRKDWCPECKKITIEKLKQHAEEKGGKCLSEKYNTADDKYTWQCKEGHIWTAIWTNVGYGNKTWCNTCNLWSFEQISDFVKKKGGIDIQSISGTGVNGRYKITCEDGHSWSTSGTNLIYSNTWCSQCLKLNLEIAKQEAKKHGGTCLDDEYVNRREEMTWQCKEGHIFKAPLGRIRNNGGWCKKCRDNELKHDISLAHEIAKKRDGICHSSEYVNLETPLLWECQKGHKWKAQLGNVMNNTWCIKCVMIKRREKCLDRIYTWLKSIEHTVITNKEEIDSEKRPKDISITIRCNKSHIFTRTLQTLMTGSLCPKCRYKSEEACREIFESIFKIPFPKKRLKILENLELDGYSEEFSIAFEYDGKQHSEYIPHFHRNGKEDLEKQKKRDELKDRLCIKNAISLIRIPYTFSYTEPEKLKEYISTQLERYGM